MDAVAQEVASLDGKAPTYLDSLDKHRLALDTGSKTLSIVQAQLEALKTQTTRSSQQLDQVLTEGRGRIEAWEDADREIASRKEGIMRNLDHYADSLNARVPANSSRPSMSSPPSPAASWRGHRIELASVSDHGGGGRRCCCWSRKARMASPSMVRTVRGAEATKPAVHQ